MFERTINNKKSKTVFFILSFCFTNNLIRKYHFRINKKKLSTVMKKTDFYKHLIDFLLILGQLLQKKSLGE